MECSKRVDVKGGACLAASRQCSCKVIFVDALGNPWCKRHAPDDERRAMIEKMARVKADASIVFDVSDLTGFSATASLAKIVAENGGDDEMNPRELSALRTCPIGGKVNMGIGGGFVTFIRIDDTACATAQGGVIS